MEYLRIQGKVEGIDNVKRKLAERTPIVWARLKTVMGESGKRLETNILSTAKSKITKQSGKLFRATYHRVVEKRGVITAWAGVRRRAYYGRFLEGGLKEQTVEVRGYSRRARDADVKQRVTNEQTGKTRRKTVAQGVGFVKPYKKQMHIKARPFVRPTYLALRATIERAIIAAVSD